MIFKWRPGRTIVIVIAVGLCGLIAPAQASAHTRPHQAQASQIAAAQIVWNRSEPQPTPSGAPVTPVPSVTATPPATAIPSPSTTATPTPAPKERNCSTPDGGRACKNPDGQDKAWGGPLGLFDKIGQAFTKAQTTALEWLVAFWVKPDTQTVSKDPELHPNRPSDSVGWLMGRLWVFTSFTAVLGLMVAAGRLAWQRRGEPAREAIGGIVTLTVVTGCIVGLVALATQAGDSYSEWIIKDSVRTNSGDTTGWARMTATVELAAPSNWAISMLLGMIVFLAALTQLALMIVRSVMLGLLTGFLPLLAAGTITPEGRAAYRKALGWLISFELYKPAAATVYAYGFRQLMSSDENSQLNGMVIVVLAVATLPALMRFVMPMVSSSSQSEGGGGAAAVAGAAAVGARMVPAFGGSGQGGGGRSQQPAPTGADTTPTTPSGGKPQPGGGQALSPPTGAQPGNPQQPGDPQQPGQPGSAPGPASGAGPAQGGAAQNGAARAAGTAGQMSTGVGAGMAAYGATKQAAQKLADESTGDAGGPSGSQ